MITAHSCINSPLASKVQIVGPQDGNPGPRFRGVVLSSPEEFAALVGDKERVPNWRRRLGTLGASTKGLMEPIAGWANREDDCPGPCWEVRHKAQPILDDTALLACMTYVDLNSMRARISRTPEESIFTSAYDHVGPV